MLPNIIEKYNGKILARGGKFKVLEGTDQFHRFVIIEFPSLEEGKNVGHQKNIKKLHRLEKWTWISCFDFSLIKGCK